MTEPVGPAIARQRLHTRLRELRESRPIPAHRVATAMRWSVSKLNRIENGRVTIEPIAVKALLDFYDVTDSDEIQRLVELSEISRERSWWRDRVLTDEFREFVAYEDEASHLYAYQASFVPGLLQTAEYATAITSLVRGTPAADAQSIEIVDVRMKRQESLLHRLAGSNPPALTHALDEAVLLRRVGGDRVMAGQLDQLLELARKPTVELIVLPLSLPGHAGLGGNFELLEFAGDEDADFVFIESPTSQFILRDEDDARGIRRTMDTLVKTGLTGDDALNAIKRARKVLRA
jgi:transcriptional regulator with XRE-family HTH domain